MLGPFLPFSPCGVGVGVGDPAPPTFTPWAKGRRGRGEGSEKREPSNLSASLHKQSEVCLHPRPRGCEWSVPGEHRAGASLALRLEHWQRWARPFGRQVPSWSDSAKGAAAYRVQQLSPAPHQAAPPGPRGMRAVSRKGCLWSLRRAAWQGAERGLFPLYGSLHSQMLGHYGTGGQVSPCVLPVCVCVCVSQCVSVQGTSLTVPRHHWRLSTALQPGEYSGGKYFSRHLF